MSSRPLERDTVTLVNQTQAPVRLTSVPELFSDSMAAHA
jgi:hypothetical protein